MTREDRHHYLVEHYGLDGRTIARRCFETSQGAMAYMVGHSTSAGTFKPFCVTGALCVACNPRPLVSR